MALLDNLHRKGNTIVLVTHEPDIAVYANRKIYFRDGKIVRDEKIPCPQRADRELLPFAPGFGMELGMTIDALRAGYRVVEVELDTHPLTGHVEEQVRKFAFEKYPTSILPRPPISRGAMSSGRLATG